MHRFVEEFGLTHQQIAEAVGKARATVSNLLRLMALPREVKTLLEHGDIEMGHARFIGVTRKSASRSGKINRC